ncbi:DUF3592 domain-containing protein [Paraburkholderia xenovorans]|uniref:DUF3592 domain-containing protein n=1 Tax=Paraburkholderia xenovorans TaxID=36873 RepID=UPI0038BD066E
MPVTDKLLIRRFKAIIFSMIWIGCLIGLAISVRETKNFLNTAVEASGRVVALNAGGSHPQIEFIARSGERVSYPQGGWVGGYRVGDQVQVLYWESSPRTSATINRTGAIWAWAIVLIPILVAIPLVILWNIFHKPASKRKKSKWDISG